MNHLLHLLGLLCLALDGASKINFAETIEQAWKCDGSFNNLEKPFSASLMLIDYLNQSSCGKHMSKDKNMFLIILNYSVVVL